MIQWHPLFVQLLRSLVEDYYSVDTNVPVGDLPREADILLVRRAAPAPPPFQGIWRHLTEWNVLEFKGPSDDPALRDLDLLIELGLGIDRRLNEQRTRERLPLLERAQVSFWYLANHLGRRFLAEAQALFGACEALGEGLWRCRTLQRSVFLVSRDTLPVEPDTVPLHLVCQEPEQVTLQLARVLLREPGWWQRFGSYLLLFHPHLKQEIENMAQHTGVEDEVDLRPLFKALGPAESMKQVILAVGVAEAVRQLGVPEVIAAVGLKRVLDAVGLKQVIAEVGLKQVIAEVGLKQVIAEVGLKQVIAEVSLEELLASLTPEQRTELKQRLP